MRDIKFRGHRTDSNEWIYGYLFITKKSNPTNEDAHFILNEFGSFKVELKSVGQFIGLNDMNGTEIYEGDILHYKGHFHETLHNIINRGKTIKVEVDDIFPVKFDDNKGFQMYHQGIGYYKIHSMDVKIIGNIYQDSHLLGAHQWYRK